MAPFKDPDFFMLLYLLPFDPKNADNWSQERFSPSLQLVILVKFMRKVGPLILRAAITSLL